MGEGLLITELGGLHAGANPVSGDFSLIAKGFRVAGGKAGCPCGTGHDCRKFLPAAKDIRTVGSDLEFKGSGIGLPPWIPEPSMLPDNDVYFRLRLLNQISCGIINCPEIRNF